MASLSRSSRGWLAMVLALAGAVSAWSREAPTEAELKAVFLLNFGSYVQWPEAARPAAGESFVIGVLGSDEIADALGEVARGEQVRGHRVHVRRVASEEELLACHIVYVAPGAERRLRWRQIAARPVLTVGDSEEFETAGGVVRFVRDRNRVRLRIDLERARGVGLEFSSRLLRLADVKGHAQ